jgi:hypothetical protein
VCREEPLRGVQYPFFGVSACQRAFFNHTFD